MPVSFFPLEPAASINMDSETDPTNSQLKTRDALRQRTI